MQCLLVFMLIVLLLLCFSICEAFECEFDAENHQFKVADTIRVDQSGKGDFKTVQKAIDSIPSNNKKWIRILISPGVFRSSICLI